MKFGNRLPGSVITVAHQQPSFHRKQEVWIESLRGMGNAVGTVPDKSKSADFHEGEKIQP
jgi:hypothetical protein